ncbi:MAG TPA: GNAT family N-acetyltransferase, partial [Actinopolymorphaceae bacterium]
MDAYAATVAFRPLDDGEMERFLDYDVPDDDPRVLPGGPGALADPAASYRDRVASGQYRPGWVWVAERAGDVVGRAAWWGAPDDVRPWSLDWLDQGTGADAVDIGAGLVAAGLKRVRRIDGLPPELHLFLPSDWREDPRARAAGERRISAAVAGGFRPFLERFGYRWSRADGLPPSSGRLTFRQAPDDAEVLEVLERALVDTLDGYSLHDIERYGL